MSQYVETPTKTFQANAAIAQHLRVHMDSATGKVGLSGAADASLGVMDRESFAADEFISVRLRSAQGTRKMIAGGAVTKGTRVYGGAGGKILATVSGNPEGIALESATADGDVIEILDVNEGSGVPGYSTVEAHTANDTLTAAESGSVHTNAGAAGVITFILPTAVPGLRFTFLVQAAFNLQIDPASTNTIAGTNGVQGAAGKYIGADAVGEMLDIVCVAANTWSVIGFIGTWTHEA